MNWIVKPLAVGGMAAALSFAALTPSQARDGWAWGAAGFATGLAVGAAAANSNAYYYDRPYAYAPGYAYDSYAYAPGYDSYAYVPAAPVYQSRRYYRGYDTNYVGPWRERQLQGLD